LKIAIDQKKLEIVVGILNLNLPQGVKVYSYGSRVTGKSKPYSDLDLALQSEEKLPFSVIAKVMDEFEKSELPFRVSLIDLIKTDPLFVDLIKKDLVEIWN